jgi:hypothetical protein
VPRFAHFLLHAHVILEASQAQSGLFAHGSFFCMVVVATHKNSMRLVAVVEILPCLLVLYERVIKRSRGLCYCFAYSFFLYFISFNFFISIYIFYMDVDFPPYFYLLMLVCYLSSLDISHDVNCTEKMFLAILAS